MSSPTTQADWIHDLVAEQPHILRLPEAAKLLRVSTRQIQRYISLGLLRSLKHTESGSSRVLIPRAEVERYLRRAAA